MSTAEVTALASRVRCTYGCRPTVRVASPTWWEPTWLVHYECEHGAETRSCSMFAAEPTVAFAETLHLTERDRLRALLLRAS